MSMSPEELAALQQYLGGSTSDPAAFTDPNTGIRYIWDKKTGSYISAPGVPLPTPEYPTPKTFTTKKGDLYQYDQPAGGTGPILPRLLYDEPDAPEKPQGLELRVFPDGSLRQYDYNAGEWRVLQEAPPPKPPQAPLGRQLTQWEIEKQQLDVEKARRDLMDQYTRAQADADTALRNLDAQYRSGQIDAGQRDKIAGLIHQNFESALKGTTPYQMQQGEQQQQNWNKNFQTGIAGNVLDRRAQTANSMGQALLSGASGIYGKILGGQNPPLDFNPLAMGQAFADETTGGADMSQLARSVLMGALQGGQ